MPNEFVPPELEQLAANLASLEPSRGGLERDRLLFRAGQASVTRPTWPWQLGAAAFALLACGIGVWHFSRPAAPIQERIVYVPSEQETVRVAQEPIPPSEADTDIPGPGAVASAVNLEPLNAFRLEQFVARWGVESLPEPRPLGGPAKAGLPPDLRTLAQEMGIGFPLQPARGYMLQ